MIDKSLISKQKKLNEVNYYIQLFYGCARVQNTQSFAVIARNISKKFGKKQVLKEENLKILLNEIHFTESIRVVSDIYYLTEKLGEKNEKN